METNATLYNLELAQDLIEAADFDALDPAPRSAADKLAALRREISEL